MATHEPSGEGHPQNAGKRTVQVALHCPWSDTRDGVIVNKNLSFRTFFPSGVATEFPGLVHECTMCTVLMRELRPGGQGKPPLPDVRKTRNLI